MKHPVTRFKSLKLALKELEPSIRNGRHLESGKQFDKFGGMRSREILANWLLCVAVNYADEKRLTFCSDPIGGDGIIYDEDTEETWPTEHVMVTRRQTGEAEALILQAIEQERQKGGEAYARGKTLVVFFDSDDPEWYPNKVGKQLPTPLLFAAVWVVGLPRATPDEYIYNVVSLDLSDGPAPVFYVRIPKDFDSWHVIRKQ